MVTEVESIHPNNARAPDAMFAPFPICYLCTACILGFNVFVFLVLCEAAWKRTKTER